MPAQQISNTFVVEVDGSRLPDDVDIASVVVEDHLHNPDTFVITMRDSARTALSQAKATIGATVKISVLSDAASTPQELLRGEVTALEAEILGGATFSVIRGYDQSHRLFRGRVTASYRDMTYADVAGKVAKRAGLKVGSIDSTSPTHPHISQANENDWAFLTRLAREVGYEVAVSDGKLDFRKPKTASGAPGASDLSADDALTLHVGSQLLYLRAVVTAAEQVKQVDVRSWDPSRKKALTASAPAKTVAATNGHSPAKLAAAFADPVLVSTGTPYGTSQEVEAAAKALVDEIASSFTEIEAQARGNPKLRAGAAVNIGLLGAPFDGKYLLTTTRHSYDADDGYVTSFVVSGRQERSTMRLAGGAAGGGQPERVSGVVPALVDDVNDPKDLCRVRVRFPWMDENYVSDWTRVVQPGAGKKRGLVVMPEVGDEVLAAFEQGDVRRPYVLGGLYNTEDTPEVGPGGLLDGSSKAVNNRLFTSRKGHQLVFIDADQDCGVLVSTADGKLSVRLDQAKSKVHIVSGGDVDVKADGNIKLEATGSLELKGQSVKIEAQSSFGAKGATVSVEASGPTQVKGKPLQLN